MGGPANSRWQGFANQRANAQYSQWVGREELAERERQSDPEFAIWNSCAKVCERSEDLIDAD
jgi:hypothetical protein